MSATISLTQDAYNEMQENLKYYEELLGFYEAKKVADQEKTANTLQKLDSLETLFDTDE